MALGKGLGVAVMLFETMGGFSPDFARMLKEAAAVVDNWRRDRAGAQDGRCGWAASRGVERGRKRSGLFTFA